MGRDLDSNPSLRLLQLSVLFKKTNRSYSGHLQMQAPRGAREKQSQASTNSDT